MDKRRNYDVSFAGLSLGTHTVKFHLTQEFFDLFDFDQEFRNPNIDVELTLDKNTTFLDFLFKMNGTIEVENDLTGEPYTEEIKGDMEIVVKFGEDYDDSDDEVLIIPHGEYKVNVAQLLYELVLLNIPTKHIGGDLNSEQAKKAMELLEQYSPKEELEESEEDKEIDPRWEALKKLKK